MPVVETYLLDSQYERLHFVLEDSNLTEQTFLKNAILDAIANYHAVDLAPIKAVRGSVGTYKEATGPFLIIEAPRGVLIEPMPLTRTNLLELRQQGIEMVNLQFQVAGGTREPDFSMRELLGE